MFINIHTHNPKLGDDTVEVNIIEFTTGNFSPSKYSCIGIHPWEVDNINIDEQLNSFEKYLEYHSPWAIGEIGLDKKHHSSFNKQKKVFMAQLRLATKYKIPRLVIHSISSSNEIIKLLKSSKFDGKILLHDFNMNEEIANEFQASFDTYFSFGNKLFNPKTKASKVINKLPYEKIFLETDDTTKYTISDIYDQYKIISGLEKEECLKLFDSNFKRFSL